MGGGGGRGALADTYATRSLDDTSTFALPRLIRHTPALVLTLAIQVQVWSQHTALSDQRNHSTCILHGAHYLKDRVSRSAVFAIPGVVVKAPAAHGGAFVGAVVQGQRLRQVGVVRAVAKRAWERNIPCRRLRPHITHIWNTFISASAPSTILYRIGMIDLPVPVIMKEHTSELRLPCEKKREYGFNYVCALCRRYTINRIVVGS